MTESAHRYPVNLDLNGRNCLVVGGGSVAARKIAGLVAAGAHVTVIAPEVSPDLASNDALVVHRRPYRRGDVVGFALVITTTDDVGVNAAVAADAEAAGIWVNSADDPVNCGFTLGSVMRVGPIQIMVSTGGRSPAYSAWLRREFEGLIGADHEGLIDVMATKRDEMRSTGRPTEVPGWNEALAAGLYDLVAAGDLAAARALLDDRLD